MSEDETEITQKRNKSEIINDIIKKIKIELKEYKNILRPDFKKIRIESKIPDERVEIIRMEEAKFRKKYKIFMYPLGLILIYMIYKIGEVRTTTDYPIELIISTNFQFYGLILSFIGTGFLAKGFLKNENQIALESSTRLGYNSDIIKSQISSKMDTQIGIIYIGTSFFIQVIAIFFSAALTLPH